MEKLAFSLVTVVRKLRPYFQAHVINVLTDHPLKKVMNELEVARCAISTKRSNKSPSLCRLHYQIYSYL